MPTGRIVHAGGLTTDTIQVPTLPAKRRGIRQGMRSDTDIREPINTTVAQPNVGFDYGASSSSTFYGYAMVTEIAKANFIAPSNQGHRAALWNRQTLMYDARNSPSRSQISEGYTEALQAFAASNTWQLAGPVDSPGTRAKQPNQKFVSPFASLPIPTRMPWDL